MRSRFSTPIDQIMSTAVVQVDKSDSLQTALHIMQTRGLRKLLLVDQGVPSGLVEDWLVEKLAATAGATTAIGAAMQRFGVGPAPVMGVDAGTSVEDVKAFLGSYAAVVVRGKDPKKAAGIVTATDLEKLL